MDFRIGSGTRLVDLVFPMKELRRLLKAKAAYEKAMSAVRSAGGNLLKDVRVKHGLSQMQMAQLLRIHPVYLSRIETDKSRAGVGLLLRLLDVDNSLRLIDA